MMSNENTKIVTPSLSCVKRCDWNYVYEPSEDTFLMLDALEHDLNYIQKNFPKTVLEVGSGAGIIVTSLSQILKSHSHCMAIDINEHACKLSKRISIHNKAFVDVLQGDLMSCIKEETIDLIVFNPPYVVTTSTEILNGDVLTKSWAGGVSGMEVTNRFLNMLSKVLSESGFGYLLLLKENQPKEVIKKLKNDNFECEIVKTRKIRCEELFVLKFRRKKHF